MLEGVLCLPLLPPLSLLACIPVVGKTCRPRATGRAVELSTTPLFLHGTVLQGKKRRLPAPFLTVLSVKGSSARKHHLTAPPGNRLAEYLRYSLDMMSSRLQIPLSCRQLRRPCWETSSGGIDGRARAGADAQGHRERLFIWQSLSLSPVGET